MTIGSNIKAARKKAQLTQKELGNKLGVSGTMIAMYETDQRKPKIQALNRIAIALNTNILDLLDNVDNGDDLYYLIHTFGAEPKEKEFSSAVGHLFHSHGLYIKQHETDPTKSILYNPTYGDKYCCKNAELDKLIESVDEHFACQLDILLGKCETE